MASDLQSPPRTTPSAEQTLDLATTLCSPRSGSTLLAILLGRHSQLSSDGETFPQNEPGSVACSCGQFQIDCPYYRRAAAHMLAPGGADWDEALFTSHPVYSKSAFVDRLAGRAWGNAALNLGQTCLRSLVPAWRRRDREFVDAHFRFMENSLRMRQARIYVDGCKDIRRATLFADSGRFRMKVIHLVRDGRGFCHSYLKNGKTPRPPLAFAARVWLKELRAVERFLARRPELPVLNVRYEDLCHDLPGALKRICAFLDVPYESALESTEPPACHVLGNRMRMTFSGKVAECLRWRQEFTPQEVDFLNRVLRAGLDRYHYPV